MQPPVTPDDVIHAARRRGISARHALRIVEGSPDVATFDVDDAWMFRFAATDAAAVRMRRERSVLRAVSGVVGVPIPRYEHWGSLGGRAWGAYRKIRGVSGEEQQPPARRWPELADQLAAMLTALHALPPGVVAPASPSGEPLDARALARFAPVIEEGAADVVDDEIRRYLRGEIGPVRSAEVALCHGDLKGEHIILATDGSRVAGVLDWADAGANDPAVDFAGLLIWLGPGFVRAVLARYRPRRDEAFFARAVTLARLGILRGLGATLAGEDAWPLDLAKRQLERAFRAE